MMAHKSKAVAEVNTEAIMSCDISINCTGVAARTCFDFPRIINSAAANLFQPHMQSWARAGRLAGQEDEKNLFSPRKLREMQN